MNQYEALWGYSATVDNQPISFDEGDTVWLPKATADFINRDSPGVLKLLQTGAVPHTHRMVVPDKVFGLRDVETAVAKPADVPKVPTPAATPAATILAEMNGVALEEIGFAGDKITVHDVRSHLGDDSEQSAQPDTVFAATKSGESY